MPGNETRFAVLLFTDIVGSTGLKARHGVPAYSEALRTHNGHFERIARECLHARTLQGRGDGYFAEASSVTEALRFALLFQEAMREGPWGEVRLTARVGIHAGEVGVLNPEGDPWIVAPAADLAARVADLALGGQILLTRVSFDEARHFIREHPSAAERTMPPLRWLAHGPYLMKGRDEPLEVFEVGAEGLAPLVAPPDGEKAKRAIRPGEEETLGWRPAVGLEIPGRVGWHLTERLGAGGFGEVWVGEHAKLHERRAFKFCFDDERLRALKREVTLVRLLRSALGERDDIVQIHELKLDAPPFYLESDLAPHGNLLQWAKEQGGLEQIPLAERIALVAHTATALAAAHSIGVLHKDIKPTNILIFDGPNGEPLPRLVDFGIGTLADPEVLGKHGVTAAGFTRGTAAHSTGTPTYSPPEYLAGRPYTIQGDIYGLGILLYQLVTAKPCDPLAPGWERDIADLLLREDIAACVDGDPGRRLPSATDLAGRLLHLGERHAEIEDNERLAREAARRTEMEAAAHAARIRARRFRRLAAAFALLSLLAIVGGLLAWWQRGQAVANEKNADTQRSIAEAQKNSAIIERNRAEDLSARRQELLAEAARSDRLVAEEKLHGEQDCQAFAYLARACEYDSNSSWAAEKAAAALNKWRHPLPATILTGHTDVVWRADFSPDGSRIATAARDHTARIWDVGTGNCLIVLNGHTDAVVDVHFSPDGRRIVTASHDKTARLWDTTTGNLLLTISGHEGAVESAQFSSDGKRIITTAIFDNAHVWDAVSGKKLSTLGESESYVSTAQFSPDGKRSVIVSSHRKVELRNNVTQKAQTLPLAPVEGETEDTSPFTLVSAQLSPDGSRLITSCCSVLERLTANPELWDATSGKLYATLKGHSGSIYHTGFSRDGARIITTSTDKTARIWDAASGKNVTILSGHQELVRFAEFNPDGTRVVTVSEDKTVRLWDSSTGRNLAILVGYESDPLTAHFSPDGRRILVTSKDKNIRLWSLPFPQGLVRLDGHKKGVCDAQFGPNGTRIATVSLDETIRVWNAESGESIATSTENENLERRESKASIYERPSFSRYRHGSRSVHFSPDGMRILSTRDEKAARIWDVVTGKCLAVFRGHQGNVLSAQFDPQGTRIVTASDDNTARVWDAATGWGLFTLEGHKGGVGEAQFSPDGTRIVTSSWDHSAKVWDGKSGGCVATLEGHSGFVLSAHFNQDGTRIVTASDDDTARVWNAVTGESLLTLKGHERHVLEAQFSADGTRIVTASGDNTARVWDTVTGATLAVLIGHRWGLNAAQFSHDGLRIVTASTDGTARIWDPVTGKCLAVLEDTYSELMVARFARDGSRILTASEENTAHIWSVLPTGTGPPPHWFPDFLRYMAQMRLSPDGELEQLKADEWLALRERMLAVRHASVGQDTPYLRILSRFVRESLEE